MVLWFTIKHFTSVVSNFSIRVIVLRILHFMIVVVWVYLVYVSLAVMKLILSLLHVLELDIDVWIDEIWLGEIKLLDHMALLQSSGMLAKLVILIARLEIFLTWKAHRPLHGILIAIRILVLILIIILLVVELLGMCLLIVWVLKLHLIAKEIGILILERIIVLNCRCSEESMILFKI